MATAFSESDDASVPYFAVSPLKLAAMSLATSGLYDIYWFYASWRQIERRTGLRKQPLGQALVLWLSLFNLAGRANRSLRNQGLRRIAVGTALPAAYLTLRLLERSSGRLALLSMATAVVPLTFLQRELIRANREAGVSVLHRPGLSRWDVLALVLLAPLTLLVVLDAFEFQL
jgi:hypothetical protein